MPKDAPGEPNKRYGKLLTRLTGPSKPREMATIQAFCAWRDPSNGGRAVAFGAQTWSRAAPALRLSLPHRHLVNSVDGVPASRRHPAAHRHPCFHPALYGPSVARVVRGDRHGSRRSATATPALAGCLQGELLHLDLIVVEYAKTERPCDLDMLDLAVQELASIVGLR